MVGAAPGRSSSSGVGPDIHQDKLEGKMQVVGNDHHSDPAKSEIIKPNNTSVDRGLDDPVWSQVDMAQTK